MGAAGAGAEGWPQGPGVVAAGVSAGPERPLRDLFLFLRLFLPEGASSVGGRARADSR